MRSPTTTAATKKAVATTVDWLIYAVGAGLGHARRGWLLQRELQAAGHSALLLVRPSSDRHLPAGKAPRILAESLADPALRPVLYQPPRTLVVDTFASGWRGELRGELPERFASRVWLARHSRSHSAADAARFHRVLSPYPASRCEWDGRMPAARHGGYLVDAAHLDLRPDRRHFALVDSERRCNARLLDLLQTAARRAGLAFRLHRCLHDRIRAAKLLVVGAGYHSFYECLSQEVDVRFLPVEKRHDDQHRRARRFRRALSSLDELLPWLTAPASAPAAEVRIDHPAVLAALGLTVATAPARLPQPG